MPAYVIDLRHLLDEEGAIAAPSGPALRLARFVTAAVAHASDFDRPEDTPGPVCFRCRQRDAFPVATGLTDDQAVIWHCLACDTHGRISDWQGSFWDLGHGLSAV